MPRIRHIRCLPASIVAATAVLLAAATLWADDLDAIQTSSGDTLHVRGQTGSHFPASESAVALDRIADARLVSTTFDERLTDLSHSGTSLLIRHGPTLHARVLYHGIHIPLARGGLWNVRTLHVVQSEPNSGADWDTHRATLVFQAGPSGEHRAKAGVAEAAVPARSGSAKDPANVAHTVQHFHEALEKGDSAGALALLAPNAVILESGGVETRDEYRAHHLSGDIVFARAVKTVRGAINVTVRGDVSWASSTSTAQGHYNGRAINSLGAELMVLTRSRAGWRINAIHWSSRQHRQ